MQEGTGDAAVLVRRIRRAIVWLLLSLFTPALVIAWRLLRKSPISTSGPPIIEISVVAVVVTLAAVLTAAGAAVELRSGGMDSAAASLGCAAIAVSVTAALVALPGVAAATLGLGGLIIRMATAGPRDPHTDLDTGCALIFLGLGVLALGYAIPALIGGAMLRGVMHLLRRR